MNSDHRAVTLCKNTNRFVTQSDDVRDGAGSTIFHDDPQVCVLEVAAIVLHHIGTRRKCKTEWFLKFHLRAEVRNSHRSRHRAVRVANYTFKS